MLLCFISLPPLCKNCCTCDPLETCFAGRIARRLKMYKASRLQLFSYILHFDTLNVNIKNVKEDIRNDSLTKTAHDERNVGRHEEVDDGCLRWKRMRLELLRKICGAFWMHGRWPLQSFARRRVFERRAALLQRQRRQIACAFGVADFARIVMSARIGKACTGRGNLRLCTVRKSSGQFSGEHFHIILRKSILDMHHTSGTDWMRQAGRTDDNAWKGDDPFQGWQARERPVFNRR